MAKLTQKNLYEIKLHYEYGEDLQNLAARFKVSLSTLEKRKAKDEKINGEWGKGSRADVGYRHYTSEQERAREEALGVVMEDAKNKVKHLNNIFTHRANSEQKGIVEENRAAGKGEQPKKKLVLAMAPEIAFSTKVNSTKTLIELNRLMVSKFMTTEELQILKFKHQTEQDQLDNERADKRLELDSEIKKADLIIKAESVLINKKKAGEGGDQYEDSGIDNAIGEKDADSIIGNNGDLIEE